MQYGYHGYRHVSFSCQYFWLGQEGHLPHNKPSPVFLRMLISCSKHADEKNQVITVFNPVGSCYIILHYVMLR